MSNVIEIGALILERNNKQHDFGQCQHIKLTIDDHGQTVTCRDCQEQVTPFWALTSILKQWDSARKQLINREAVIAKTESTLLATKAAQKVEEAWRRRSMVPTCPHCYEAIYATDNFGGGAIAKEIADRRRDIRLEERKKKLAQTVFQEQGGN